MERTISLASHSDCTGCSACYAVCPRYCIQMHMDGFFSYPVIDEEKCVNCGLCMKACPAVSGESKQEAVYEQKYYAAWIKDTAVRRESTSGGIGSALAETAISNGWYVCGAAFDEKWGLSHKVVSVKGDISMLRGSKYLQSETAEAFQEVKSILKRGDKVLFIGTPCQVDGVQRIVPESLKEQLYTCAIICHGVNSPVVWKDYVSYLEARHNSNLEQYNFRSKSHGWGQNSRGSGKLYIDYSFKNGRKKDEPAWKNLFHVWFGQHFMLRESCFNCRYRVQQRMADITIGDFWGLSQVNPELLDSDGVSVAITSSLRGDRIISECSLIVAKEVLPEKTIPVLKGFIEKRSQDLRNLELKRRLEFEALYEKNGFDYMSRLHPCPSLWDKIKVFLKHHLHLKG